MLRAFGAGSPTDRSISAGHRWVQDQRLTVTRPPKLVGKFLAEHHQSHGGRT